MRNSSLISIIIPTYNRAHIIGETLSSLLAQTYTNWECIIVDDGSTDNTEEVIQTFADKDARFQHYKRPKTLQKGPSVCRNFGYEQSKGEYIQWFDSDDLMHPEKLTIKFDYALKYQADVIVDKHSDSNFTDDIRNFKVDSFTSSDFYIDFILGERPVITNDVMLKRKIIGKERFDEHLWKGEEYEFYSRVFQQKLTYCFLDVALTQYRISPDSISISPKQTESLIYLSNLLQKRHTNNTSIVNKAEKQGRKTYKSLIRQGSLKKVFRHFNFFKKAYNKGTVVFFLYVWYNFITGRGFDKIKPKSK